MNSSNGSSYKRGNKFLANYKGGDSNATGPANTYPTDAVEAEPLQVEVHNGQFDRAFKAFKMMVQKDRILSLYKQKQSYEKPSEKKRRKRSEARQKAFEIEMKRNRPNRRKGKDDLKEVDDLSNEDFIT